MTGCVRHLNGLDASPTPSREGLGLLLQLEIRRGHRAAASHDVAVGRTSHHVGLAIRPRDLHSLQLLADAALLLWIQLLLDEFGRADAAKSGASRLGLRDRFRLAPADGDGPGGLFAGDLRREGNARGDDSGGPEAFSASLAQRSRRPRTPFLSLQPDSMCRSAGAVWVGAVYLETGGPRKVEMTRGVSFRTRRPVSLRPVSLRVLRTPGPRVLRTPGPRFENSRSAF